MIIFTVMNIYFSKSYQNPPEGFFPWIYLFPECIIPSDFLRLLDNLDILFYKSICIYRVNLDRLFHQGWVKWYSERHWRCSRQKKNEAF